MAHFETSAKDDLNVKEGFLEVVKQALANVHEEDMYIPPTNAFKPKISNNRPPSGSCC